jgi:catechol 1,2-dioxygenase
MIYKPGFKTLISQTYVPNDDYLKSDVQFGVTRALIGVYVRYDEPDVARGFKPPWYSLDQRFVLERGEASRPKAPIHAKALQRV